MGEDEVVIQIFKEPMTEKTAIHLQPIQRAYVKMMEAEIASSSTMLESLSG